MICPDGSRTILTAGSAGDGKAALDAHSAFEIGSVTKTFTGVLLAEAVRRGEVKLADPVAKHLPRGVRVPDRGGRQITLLDLATHSAGLPKMPTDWDPIDDLNPYAGYDSAKLYKFLGSYELPRDIGSKPEYSNLGMAVLGLALANAAKASDYKTLVLERIIRPLGLTETAFGATPFGSKMTVGHDKSGNPVPHWDVDAFAGAGGINTTVADMLTYLEAHISAAESPIETSMRAAYAPRRALESEGWQVGLGWQVRDIRGHRIVNHGGSTGGYGSHVAFDPNLKTAAVVLANTDDFRGQFLINLLAPLPELTEISLPSGALAAYVGEYRISDDLTLNIFEENGALYGQQRARPPAPRRLSFSQKRRIASSRRTSTRRSTFFGARMVRCGRSSSTRTAARAKKHLGAIEAAA